MTDFNCDWMWLVTDVNCEMVVACDKRQWGLDVACFTR